MTQLTSEKHRHSRSAVKTQVFQPSFEAGQTEVTAELLARHDQPGPRYTSYPTAVEFDESFTASDYERLLAASTDVAPLSIYVHLPFCRERCLFCACNVIISPHRERALPYLDLLNTEIGMVADRLPVRRELAQLHLGGGTPTYYEPDELGSLVEAILLRFPAREGAELAVEVDPRVTKKEHLDALAQRGFNRLSLGIQDLDPRVQRAINRVQSTSETRDLIQHARHLGFSGINVDLIYGLPHQTESSFARTLEAVVQMDIDRAAVYSFAFVPSVGRQQQRLPVEALPDRNQKFALLQAARRIFAEAGYESIGMDHFARPQDELAIARREGRLHRNFQGYTVLPGTEVIGLGISAIGDYGGCFVQNHKKLSRYRVAIQQHRLPVQRGLRRNRDDEVRRSVIQQLMCNFRVDVAAIERSHEIAFACYFEADLERLRRYAEEGLVVIDEAGIQATLTGQFFVRNLAMCFDRHWHERHAGSDHPVFSRTV
jgi:oxygen-independent coproporphyrinogen-3 oxidase